ncbi:PREDICTED: uncharacterized protein LOC109586938 [Amphimedon queenslandica]|uniref:Uncharacterized protein n=1 Tax=Amphimedon queenslandica TaxID=400682 RepID=A0A1X7TN12_AMPQE|nr:PREDICTED: uncharacterized protein LOC109586938 [Amphimedon queenslandica]|eukprot:XP_019858713.1 PREDICTED: uncharacterized protein LOC109586938 [Amphimedon queenslandica]
MRFGRFLFRTRATSSEGTDQSPVSNDSKNSVSSKQIENDVFYAEEVVQKILKTDLTDIRLKGHWLYVIDSGGQPAYQELLPLFTRAASLNIITLDLSKPLDEEFDTKYRANEKYFWCRSKSTQLASFKSAVSTAANFKSLDISCITEPHHHSMHLILGTHYDKVNEADLKKCEDALKSSISSLQPYLNDRIIKRSENSIIFPVNTVAKSKEERAKYRKEVCKAIWKSGSDASITIKIPIHWFAFELSLPKKKSIISIKEAESIGKKFGMKEEDTKEALKYFHDVSLMLYYPEVINVVFLNPKPILDIMSQLLALTFVDDENTCKNKKALNNLALLKSILVEQKQVSIAKRNNLKDGFFNEEIFTNLKSGKKISQSEFNLPEDLISLLLHLNIITKVEGNKKGRYFIPYALPSYQGLKTPTIKKPNARLLLVVWIDEKKCLPVPQGLFPLVVIHLLNQKELKIDLPSSRRDFYFKFRDAMSIRITLGEIPHTLHLINRYTHIEIAFTGPQEHCSKIYEVVMKAFGKVTDDLHIEHNHANAFVCPNDPKNCFSLVVNKERFIVNCTDCPETAPITGEDYWCWFKHSTNAPVDTSKSPTLGITGYGLVILLVLAGWLVFYFCSIQGVAIYGLVLLFAFIGYFVFIWKSTRGVAIYGLIILAIFVVGYLVFIWKSIQGLVIYGLVLLVLPLLVLAEFFSIWGSIARITVSVVVIGIATTWIMTWINGGDVTKLESLVNLGTTILNLL